MSTVNAEKQRVDLVFPRFKLLSGAERAILGLAEALARGGHAPRIVCHQFDDSCRPRLADGVDLVMSGARLDWAKNRYINAIFDYGRTLKLAALLDPGADFRVFFGPALLLARRGLSRSRRQGIPSIYYCWEPPRVLYQDRHEVLRRIGVFRWPMAAALALYAVLDRRMVEAVDAVVTSSPFAAQRIEETYQRLAGVITLGIDRQRLDAGADSGHAASSRLDPTAGARGEMPPPSRDDTPPRSPGETPAPSSGDTPAPSSGDTPAPSSGDTPAPSSGDTPAPSSGDTPAPCRLLTVNYLHPRKRVDLIVAALAELERKLGSAAGGQTVTMPTLTIVGDGPERSELEALAQRLGVAQRVEFAGFVADEDLPRYYAGADCYVHATRDESFGLSVIEASYCGLPIVAVDEGGVRDTVEDGATGYRVAATSVAIADGIARLLTSPDRGRGFGEAGRAMVAEQYRWSRGAEDLLDVARGVEDGWSGSR